MIIKPIEDKKEWEEFVQKQPFYTFINSWDWGEFNELMGSKIFRMGFYEGERLEGLALVIKIEARRGTHLFCPYGPMFETAPASPLEGTEGNIADYFKKLDKVLPELKKCAKHESACFLRIHSPALVFQGLTPPLPPSRGDGFRPSPIHVHAEDTWLLDLCHEKLEEISLLSDEELLSNMRKTTRYMIKRATKEGVKVGKNNSEEYIDKFIEMHKKHSSRERGNYTAFSNNYIKNLFKVFPDEDINLMYAEYPLFASRTRTTNPGHTNDNMEKFNSIEAMLVSIKYGKTTAYYLGASDIKHPKFSPAYLLQWEAIKKARDAGCEYYNFWGVSPDDNPKHPLSGVSLFKKGFGGYDYKLMHAQDLPLTSKYWLNWAVESMRRIRRGYYYKN